MTADPVSPVIADHDGHGHQADGDARDSNADGSELSFDPEEPLFDEDDGEISGLPPEEWGPDGEGSRRRDGKRRRR